MHLHLPNNFAFEIKQCAAGCFQIDILKDRVKIGSATFVTDEVDVGCITKINLPDDYVSVKLDEKHTLGEALVKLLLKFPFHIRKQEFRFVLVPPESFGGIFDKYHFDRGEGASIENEILIRSQTVTPGRLVMPTGVAIREVISEPDMDAAILDLLKNTAYWQVHLTKERLALLLKNSLAFVAVKDEKIVGFLRILTDRRDFASLWDVVVSPPLQRQGIGTAMMHHVFTRAELQSVKNWILFTDTAASLYQKFGFCKESEIPGRTLLHKLRLQEQHPAYMARLVQAVKDGLPDALTASECMQFLFGTKRASLTDFWKHQMPAPASLVASATADATLVGSASSGYAP